MKSYFWKQENLNKLPKEKTGTMKIKTLIIVLVVVGFSACTQRLCPTYAVNDAPQTEKSETVRI